VLDAANAGLDGRPCTFIAVGMTKDEDPLFRRLVDDGTELRLGVDLLPGIGVGTSRALRAPGLDDPGAVRNVDADQLPQVLLRLGSGSGGA
jgi:hypothetical protein